MHDLRNSREELNHVSDKVCGIVDGTVRETVGESVGLTFLVSSSFPNGFESSSLLSESF